MLHQFRETLACFLRGPEFHAIVQIHAGLNTGLSGGNKCFLGNRRRTGAECGGNTGDMEPFRALKNLVPGNHSWLDGSNGRSLAIVHHTAGTGRGPKLQEVQSKPVILGIDHMGIINPGFTGMVGN